MYNFSEVNEGELEDASSTHSTEDIPSLTLVRKQFTGRYAISSDEFTSETVSLKFSTYSYGVIFCFLHFLFFTIDWVLIL